jgi:hypothetical protein
MIFALMMLRLNAVENFQTSNLNRKIMLIEGQIRPLIDPSDQEMKNSIFSLQNRATVKFLCSEKFLENIKIEGINSNLCDDAKPLINGTPSELISILANIDMSVLEKKLQSENLTLELSTLERENSNSKISISFQFGLARTFPLLVPSSMIEIPIASSLTNSVEVAEVPSYYALNPSQSNLLVELIPPSHLISPHFIDSKLYLSFGPHYFQDKNIVEFRVTDISNGLKSDVISIELKTSSPLSIQTAKNLDRNVIMIFVVLVIAFCIFGFLVILLSKAYRATRTLDDQNSEVTEDREENKTIIINSNDQNERVLTESILQWNKSMLMKHKSRTMSTLDGSDFINESAWLPSDSLELGQDDFHNDEVLSAEKFTNEEFENSCIVMNDDSSVFSLPEFRVSAFL